MLEQIKREVEIGPLSIRELSAKAVIQLQQILQIQGYYDGALDGIVGEKTLAGFAKFKKDLWLGFPDAIGITTVEKLEQFFHRDPISEQIPKSYPVLDAKAGKKEGVAMLLPSMQKVFSKEYVVFGIPLTWGELTKEGTRVPKTIEIERNLIKVAREFGAIRAKYGSPLSITSAYRPPELKIGAKHSQHKLGLALDIFPFDRNINKLWDVLKSSSAVGLGDGRHKGFCHADWRANGQRVIFGY